LLLLDCQAVSFFLKRAGGSRVASDQAMIEPIGALSKIVCADIVSSLFACAWKQGRRRLGRRR
jgi:hypothetical protein